MASSNSSSRRHLMVGVQRCVVVRLDRAISFSNLKVDLEYDGSTTVVTQMTEERKDYEGKFDYTTQFLLQETHPGLLKLTVRNGFRQFLGISRINLHRVWSETLEVCTCELIGPDWKYSGFIDLTFTYPEAYNAAVQEPLTTQCNLPTKNPPPATLSPGIAESSSSSNTPSSPSAPSVVTDLVQLTVTGQLQSTAAHSTASDTCGSLTATSSAADRVEPDTTAQMSSANASLSSLTAQRSEDDHSLHVQPSAAQTSPSHAPSAP